MKNILMFSFFSIFVLVGQVRAEDTITDFSEESIETIVSKVLELNTDGKTEEEIVDIIFEMIDIETNDDDDEDSEEDSEEEDDEDNMKSNKGKSEIKKLNFGQLKKVLRQGDNGEEVANLQEALNDLAQELGLDYEILIIDGKFGPSTAKFVRLLQTHQGLTPDGIVGPKTAEKIQKFFEVKNQQ